MATTGTAILNFGSNPGANSTSVVVTGQGSITTSNNVEAFWMYDTTSDHTANDHLYANLMIELNCGTIINGTGFTIYAVSIQKMTGTFQIRWVWA